MNIPVGAALPCIRCCDCVPACPANLQPHMLLQHLQAGNVDRARHDGIDACSECGRCDAACPSHIPLARTFHEGKRLLVEIAMQAERAHAARLRHEARGRRLQRESDQRAEQELARKTTLAAPDAVAAALARARAKRGGGKAEPGA